MKGTSRPSFDKAAKIEPTKETHIRNISHHELTDKLDTYSKLSKSEADKKAIEKMRKGYEKRAKEEPANHMVRYFQFEQSKKLGIPIRSWDEVDKLHKKSNQAQRDKVAIEAKKLYKQNISITKDHFTAIKRKDKQIDKVK